MGGSTFFMLPILVNDPEPYTYYRLTFGYLNIPKAPSIHLVDIVRYWGS